MDEKEPNKQDPKDIKRSASEVFSAPYVPPPKQVTPIERRRKPDFFTRFVQVTGVLGWFLSSLSILLLLVARPSDKQNIFTRFLGIVATPTGWDLFWLRVSFVLITVTTLLCLFGLLFNAKRHRRKTDRFNKSIIILLIVGAASIAAFLLLFGFPFG
ncbi:hypothetical protein LJC34_00365 [Oscillospiraceae bacterium OttesenSCG-928-G22]|nr:hypothetical protein [Oscillospiraceae bacterium OttesenSCG-928-G22]